MSQIFDTGRNGGFSRAGHGESVSQVCFLLPGEQESGGLIKRGVRGEKWTHKGETERARVVNSRRFVGHKVSVLVLKGEDRKVAWRTRQKLLVDTYMRHGSVQGIFVDDLKSYHSTPPISPRRLGSLSFVGFDAISVLHLKSDSMISRKEAYLRADLRLNKYRVMVPLEIRTPPFLSPKNRNKVQRNLLLGGESYSIYGETKNYGPQGGISVIREDENYAEKAAPVGIPLRSPSSDILPDTKCEGIDVDANANVRTQFRNSSRNSLLKSKYSHQPKLSFYQARSKSETVLMVPGELDSFENCNKNLCALDVLSTPFRLIVIPDFEKVSSPSRKNVLSGFFSLDEDMTETGGKKNATEYNNRITGSFKFPRPTTDSISYFTSKNAIDFPNQLNSKNNQTEFLTVEDKHNFQNNKADFLRVPDLDVNDSVEKRRLKLQKQHAVDHNHKRSRSILSMDAILNQKGSKSVGKYSTSNISSFGFKSSN